MCFPGTGSPHVGFVLSFFFFFFFFSFYLPSFLSFFFSSRPIPSRRLTAVRGEEIPFGEKRGGKKKARGQETSVSRGRPATGQLDE